MGTRDPLEQFRPRKPQQGKGSPPPGQPPPAPTPQEADELEPPGEIDPRTGKEVYHAFRVSSRKLDRLEIRPEAGVFVMPRYFDMRDIVPNRRIGTEIVLPFPAYDVFVSGRCLKQIIYALKESRCVYIEAYDPDFHAPVADDGTTPFIRSIQVVPKGGQPANAPRRQIERQDA